LDEAFILSILGVPALALHCKSSPGNIRNPALCFQTGIDDQKYCNQNKLTAKIFIRYLRENDSKHSRTGQRLKKTSCDNQEDIRKNT
jgi:hypothetical protein